MTSDADLFARCMALPQQIETSEGREYCETPEHLRAIFFAVTDHFRKTGVTDIVRHCVAAEFRDPDTIEATHETRLLAGNQIVKPAYPAFSILKRIEGQWKVSNCIYAVDDTTELNRAILTPATPDPKVTQPT
jgi:hypothetical protein